MPNHFHGIVVIVREDDDDDIPNVDLGATRCLDKNNQNGNMTTIDVGVQRAAPLPSRPNVQPKSLSAIVRGFKSAVTKRINVLRDTPAAPLWQRNYYETIIRNENMMQTIQQYILTNPACWQDDSLYPNARP